MEDHERLRELPYVSLARAPCESVKAVKKFGFAEASGLSKAASRVAQAPTATDPTTPPQQSNLQQPSERAFQKHRQQTSGRICLALKAQPVPRYARPLRGIPVPHPAKAVPTSWLHIPQNLATAMASG